MQFLMLVCKDTEPIEPAPTDVPDVDEWVKTNDAKGRRLFGNPIHPDSEAHAVRVRGGEVLVTDGPFIETKEIVAGFDVLEVRDLAEAIEVAAAHEMAYTGVIELRQIRTD